MLVGTTHLFRQAGIRPDTDMTRKGELIDSKSAAALACFEAVYLPDRPARSGGDDNAVRVEVLEEGQAVGLLRMEALLILCFDAGRSTAQSLPQEAARLFHMEFATEAKEEAIDE